MVKLTVRQLSWQCIHCRLSGDIIDALRFEGGASRCPACAGPVMLTTNIGVTPEGRIVLSDAYKTAGAAEHDRFGVVHVVLGETGEWADRKMWPVIAYATWADAKRHAVLAELEALCVCTAACARIGNDVKPGGRFYGIGDEIQPGDNVYDAHMRVDTNGVRYSVVGVPFRV